MVIGPDPTDHYARIYSERADDYEVMTSREDYEGNVAGTLDRIRRADGLDVVDLGAGTGRLACLLASRARSVAAFDLAAPMLRVAHDRLKADGVHNWCAAVSDHRAIPLPDASADLVVSGWSLVYTVVWYQETWQNELNRALREIERVLRPGGTAVVFETMGTGHEVPVPPTDLLPYFSYLEDVGFASEWFRTDFKFTTQDEARSLTTFFFGEEMAGRTIGTGPVILPECTGVWWRTF